MPNIVAHMVVGAEAFQSDDQRYIVGCALPDFIGMYRDLRGGQLRAQDFGRSPELSHGIRMHYRTDDIYNALELKKDLSRAARADLQAITPPLGRGAVRACADAGTEILLDGVLLQHQACADVYNTVRTAVLDDTLHSSMPDEEFHSMVRDYFGYGTSYRYQDPESVAVLLQYRFQRRPTRLLQFDEDAIPAVAEAFDIQIARLQRVARVLLRSLVNGVGPGNTAPALARSGIVRRLKALLTPADPA